MTDQRGEVFHLPAAPGTMSVSTAILPDGQVMVLLQLGPVVATLTPQGAAELADTLAVEAAYAAVKGTSTSVGPDRQDDAHQLAHDHARRVAEQQRRAQRGDA